MDSSEQWSNARNVLAVRLDGMGDVLMTSPAMLSLKSALVGRRLTLLTSSAAAEAARLLPMLDEVMIYDAPWMKNKSADDEIETPTIVETLRQRRFDAAVVFTVYSQSPLPAATTCMFAGIPLRAAHCRENPYRILTRWLPEREPAEIVRHEVRRQLDLAEAVGGARVDDRLDLRIADSARGRARRRLLERGVGIRQRFAVFHVGATAPSRRYSPEQFAEAATLVHHELGLPIVFTGSLEEARLIESVQKQMNAPSTALLDTTTEEYCAVIAEAAVLVSNNTSAVHVASATKTPVVVLYALTNPQHGPWRTASRTLYHDVPCRCCYKSVCPQGHHDCLRLVEPQQVFQAVCDLLRPPRRSAVEAVHPMPVLVQASV